MKKLIVLILLCFVSSVSDAWVNKPMLGRQINWSHPSAKGLVGCWLMNEGSGNKVLDLSGNGWDGTFQNDTHWVPGKFGSALDFDGTGDYVSTNLAVGTTMYVSFWVKPDVINIDKAVMFSWRGVYLDSVMFYSSKWNFWSSGGGFDINPASPTPVVGKWHHVVAGFETGVAAYLYVDGQLIGSDSSITTPTINVVSFGGTTQGDCLNGQIDNVMVFNRVLSASQIAQLYQNSFYMFEPSFNWFLYGGIAVPTVGGQVIFVNIN